MFILHSAVVVLAIVGGGLALINGVKGGATPPLWIAVLLIAIAVMVSAIPAR